MKNSFMICLVETKLTENVANHELTQNGWNIFRCDRKRRLGGGVAIYVKEEFPVSDILSHSTDICDTICIYLPETNLAQITTYRPPGSSIEHFKESIDIIRKWIYDMENKYDKTPMISLNGDLNFPMMKSWSYDEICTFLENIYNRESNESNIGSVKQQTKLLCELVEDLFLEQKIDGATRKNNLLDLQFTNDPDLFLDHEILENVLFSDHCICILNTNLESKNVQEINVNYYTSDIPSYNLMEASEEDWKNLNEILEKNDWEDIFRNKNESDITDILIKIVENSVKEVMK